MYFVTFIFAGKKTTMMSTRNFYNAMTPGSSLTSEMMIGKSAYKQIQESEINSRSKLHHQSLIPFSTILKPSNNRFLKNSNKLPVQGGTLLNSINEKVSYFNVHTSNVAIIQGLLSYTDFHFLLLLMSTPTRYLDIIFRGFDISADGNVEAKVVFKAASAGGKRYCKC